MQLMSTLSVCVLNDDDVTISVCVSRLSQRIVAVAIDRISSLVLDDDNGKCVSISTVAAVGRGRTRIGDELSQSFRFFSKNN
jgi:hypothetical protein